ARWSVSSYLPLFGIEHLTDENSSTYWASDSPYPRVSHSISLVFEQPTWVKLVSLFIDYFQDTSYTPHWVSIRGGTGFHDMQQIMEIECRKVVGWQHADLESTGEAVRVYRLQIVMMTAHENGKDVHVRQVKV
ncbi:anaphase-promoting complex, subunit 10/DOC domain-containing protein, partial [Spinellus fusiger]